LFGGSGKDLLDGGSNNDLLVGGKGGDTFAFARGFGKDVVRDFTDDVDTIQLDQRLWTGQLTKQQVLNKFAIVDGDNIVFDFGKHELTIQNFSDVDALFNDLQII
jgi:Ca2+-binding RTX toxin-like protein